MLLEKFLEMLQQFGLEHFLSDNQKFSASEDYISMVVQEELQ